MAQYVSVPVLPNMRTLSFFFFAAATMTGLSLDAAVNFSGASNLPSAISIDGVYVGRIFGWEGGGARATVVTQALADGTATKTLGSIKFDPLIVETAFPPPAALAKAIGDLAANRSETKALTLVDYDAVGTPVDPIEARATLTEVHLPAFDANSSAPVRVKFVFAVEESRPSKSPPTGTATTATVDPRMFALAISGLVTKSVTKIGPISIIRRAVSDDVGRTRSPTITFSPPEFSNLVVTLSEASAATWNDWFTDFAVSGNNGSDREKTASLTFFGSDFAVNFQQVGIVRVSRLPVAGTTVRFRESELYFERLTIGNPVVASSTTSASTGTTTARTSTIERVSTDSTTNPIQTPVDSTTAVRTPIAAATESSAIQTPTAVQSGTLAVLNSADTGTRDPAQFPRISGVTRTYYNGSFFSNYTIENANYRTTGDIYQFSSRISDAMKSAGFTERTHTEQGSAGERSVQSGWAKPNVDLNLSFWEQRTGGIEVQVSVKVEKQ